MHFLKEGQKIWAWVDPLPPLIRAMPERKRFFSLMSSLSSRSEVLTKFELKNMWGELHNAL